MKLRAAGCRPRHLRRTSGAALAVLGVLAGAGMHAASAEPRTPLAEIPPGEWVFQGGAGRLTIQAANGKTTFAIDTIGSNAHVCSLTGTITGVEGRTSTDDGSAPCVFRLTPQHGTLTLETRTDDACRAYCGARAWFAGKYLRPSPECMPAAVSATRATFRRLYDEKKFGQARATLEPLLGCEEVVDRFSRAWIRNDVAVTRHALHDDVGCRQVLEPLRELAADDDPGAGEPAFQDELAHIARATRYNLRLCGGT